MSPALKVIIPTILVEDEPMETEKATDRRRRRDGRLYKNRRGRSAQPKSPEEGRIYFMIITYKE